MHSNEGLYEDTYDAVIIGAGFAGAIVARELANRGLRTVILEARDRIGGRTWTIQTDDGEPLDIGGTFVHWTQPQFWAEVTRYGLTGDLVDSIETPADWVLSPAGGGLDWRTAEQHAEIEKHLMERFFEQSWTVFPRPYDPLFARDEVAALDHMTVRDRLDQLDLAADDDAHLSAVLSAMSSNTAEETSYLSLLRWWALTGHTYEGLWSALSGYKLKHGTLPLLDAILSDSGTEVRLSSPVKGVASDETGVQVTLATGEVVKGRVAVVATPSGIWPNLQFSPTLSPERLEAARAGMQTPRGSKGVVVLKGEPRNIFINGRPGDPINLLWTGKRISEDEQVVVFYCGPSMKDPEDPVEIEVELTKLLPHVELGELHASLFGPTDEFSLGGWPMLKPGQLTRWEPYENFSKQEGRVVFATGDIASHWTSFIDGAIESGLRAARDVREILR
ncbi:flavin monoamine oxidase family protein [Nocardia sp. NPDC059239]|uniref:flavin monoamine oxidase family protein n=1 Tax=unclassified Nocardia TaxID=2637762 RepID=UPI0036C6333C